MKNLGVVFAVCILFLSIVPLTGASQSIRVGIHDFEPLVFTDETGQAKGLFADVLNHIAEKEKWQIEYVFGSLQECLDRLDKGDIDLVAAIVSSDERAKIFDFTTEYLYLDWTQVYKRKGEGIETILDLDGKTIAVPKGRIVTHDFEVLKEQFGIRCRILEKEDQNQIAEAVRDKEADAGICLNIRLLKLCKQYDFESTHILFSPQKYHFAVKKGFKGPLLSKLDQYIAALKADKQSVYYESYDKWTGIYRTKDDIFKAWIWGFVLTVFSIVLMLLLFINILNRQVKQRTSELMKINEALADSEKRLRNIFDNVPIGMFQSTPEGKFVYINPAISRIMGYDSPDELMQKVNQSSIAEVLYEKPDQRATFVHIVEQEKGDWKVFENRYRCKDGRIIDTILSFCEKTEPLTGQRYLYGFVQDITERKRSEKALRENERKYRSLAENSQDYIMRYDEQCRHLYMNQASLQACGFKEEDIIGKTHRESGFDERLSELWEEKISQVFKTGKPDQAIFEWESIKGKVYLDWRLFPEVDENGKIGSVLGISRDITQIKQAEQESKKREALLSKVLEILPIGLWIADQNGKLIIGNPAVKKIWGAAPNAIPEEYGIFKARRLPSGQEIAPDDWALVRTISQGITISDELLEIDAFDGQKRIILNYTAPVLGDDGSIQGAIVLNRDITERKRAEEEKAKLESRIRHAQKMEAIGTLAGGIAHDFNNILFPIMGYTEMTMDDLPKESQAYQNLLEISKACARAGELVRQILTFGRQREQEQTVFKLHPIVKESLKLIRSSLPSTISIRQDIDSKCPPVCGDPTQIHQIMMNLCTNAYHAMETRGGELKISLSEVRLAAEDLMGYPNMTPGSYVKLSVSDTGAGMTEEIRKKIFDPFFTTKPVGKGTGLGLAVVHGIVTQMKGNIHVYSEPGIGTTFVIVIPSVQSLQTDTGFNTSSEPILPGSERVLLADDEEPVLNMLRQMLEKLGYQVTSRNSSVEAFNLFQTKPDSFDLVITDMTMPNMTGLQLAQKIIEIRPDIPIILCTGFSEQISEEIAKKTGIRGFLMKPVIRRNMAEMIRDLLKNSSDPSYRHPLT
jgi:PAS domain S-box-containing protein